MRPQPARRPRALAASCMPVLQGLGRRLDRLDDGVAVDEAVVLATVGRPVEVLTQEL